MPAPVRIEVRAWCDYRFEVLGRLRYPNMDPIDARDLAHHKFMRAVALCTRLQTYTLRPLELDGIGGSGFSRALCDSSLGELVDGGDVRVKGTNGRIEWLKKRHEAASKGGKAKAKAERASKRKQTPAKACPPSPSPSPSPDPSTPPATSEKTHAAAAVPEAPRPAPVASARWRALFEALYEEVSKGAHPAWPKEHCIMANKLLKEHGEEEVCRRTEILFHHPPDWIARGGVPDVGTLTSQWNKLARAAPNGHRGGLSVQDLLDRADFLDRQEGRVPS